MRLWSQARIFGISAARSMLNILDDFGYFTELFAHTTTFFGLKVILLGRFNAQGLQPNSYEILMRVIPGQQYVKCILLNGKMVGSVLIGETDLEVTQTKRYCDIITIYLVDMFTRFIVL
jgi:hypothetical protein